YTLTKPRHLDVAVSSPPNRDIESTKPRHSAFQTATPRSRTNLTEPKNQSGSRESHTQQPPTNQFEIKPYSWESEEWLRYHDQHNPMRAPRMRDHFVGDKKWFEPRPLPPNPL